MKQFIPPLAFILASAYLLLPSSVKGNVSPADTNKHNRLLVVCAVSKEDSSFSVKAENALTALMIAEGYSVYTGTDFVLSCCIDSDSLYALQNIRERGFTAVLIIRLADKLKKQHNPKNKEQDTRTFDLGQTWQQYYRTVQEIMYTSHKYNSCTKYAWEYFFCEVPAGQVIFSGRSKSFRYDNRIMLFNQFAPIIKKIIIEKEVLRKEW